VNDLIFARFLLRRARQMATDGRTDGQTVLVKHTQIFTLLFRINTLIVYSSELIYSKTIIVEVLKVVSTKVIPRISQIDFKDGFKFGYKVAALLYALVPFSEHVENERVSHFAHNMQQFDLQLRSIGKRCISHGLKMVKTSRSSRYCRSNN
jgi:hypothetical protein